ncbi:MAG: cytochrome C [Sphingomonadaceae bacterium]
MKPALALLVPLGLAVAAGAGALYRLPEERPIELPPAPGVALVSAHCSACHSLDYLTTQPPDMGAAFWAHTVDKMVKVHGADIPADDRATITAWLGATFGGAAGAPPKQGG